MNPGSNANTVYLRGQVLSRHAQFTSLRPGNEIPPATSSTARGYAVIARQDKDFTYSLVHTLVGTAATAQHVHFATVTKADKRAVSGNIVTLPAGEDTKGTFSLSGMTDQALTDYLNGGAYFNVHSAAFPSGEIRGDLNTLVSHGAVLQGKSVVGGEGAKLFFGVFTMALFRGLGYSRVMLTHGLENVTAIKIHGPAAADANSATVQFDLTLTSSGNAGFSLTQARSQGFLDLTPEQASAFVLEYLGHVTSIILSLVTCDVLSFHCRRPCWTMSSCMCPSTRPLTLSMARFEGRSEY